MKSAEEIFEAELLRRQLTFVRGDEPRQYRLEVGDVKLNISLENVARNYARDGDAAAIARFTDTILQTGKQFEPKWDPTHVYWSAERAPIPVDGGIFELVSDEVVRTLVVTDPEHRRVTWLTHKILADWKVDEAEARGLAPKNLSRLLEGKQPDLLDIGGEFSLGMVPVHAPFKASIIFASEFKRFIEGKVGWPVLVVIPCRDFVYVLAEKDLEFLGRIGHVVQREFRDSGYPLTTEVFRVSDEGIEAIGKFPEE